jgi:parallel beta-helix repeat protein
LEDLIVRRPIFLLLLAVSAAMVASAATTCTYLMSGSSMVLQGDCTTDAPIIIPNGITHDGAGHKITAIDPPGDHFRGAVIQNGGASASVIDTAIETAGLEDFCQSGTDKLAGILFDGASGSVSRNVILSMNKNSRPGVLSSCQEGNAIEAMNFGSAPGRSHVTIEGNTIRNYQKTGIVVNGDVNGIVTGNTVVGAGPQAFIGQNGIQIGSGAYARVTGNTVVGNSYTGSSTASGGIIVASGPLHKSAYSFGIEISSNYLAGNDVGVWLMQMTEQREAPVVPTHIKVADNLITNDALTNGRAYQAGITTHSNSDTITRNRISGAGYDPATLPGSTFGIDDSRSTAIR